MAIGGRIEDDTIVFFAAFYFALYKFERIFHNPANVLQS